MDAYNVEIRNLAVKILSLIAENLQLKPDYFEQSIGNTYQKMRMNYYPAGSWPQSTCRWKRHYTPGQRSGRLARQKR